MLYTDKYYTSHTLANTLQQQQSHLVGTVRSNRTGFPDVLQNTKVLQRYGARGDMRYVRDENICYIQWLDKRVVTVLLTKHLATDRDDATRTVRIDGQWMKQPVPRPLAIAEYNLQMGGVDAFDHLASSYSLLRQSKKSWRCLFYNLVECVTIIYSIIMKEYRCKNRGVLLRPAGYSQCNFQENLVRQLCGFEQFDSPPTPVAGWKRRCPDNAPAIAPALHLAKASLSRGNCVLCYRKEKKRDEDLVLLLHVQKQRRAAIVFVYQGRLPVLF